MNKWNGEWVALLVRYQNPALCELWCQGIRLCSLTRAEVLLGLQTAFNSTPGPQDSAPGRHSSLPPAWIAFSLPAHWCEGWAYSCSSCLPTASVPGDVVLLPRCHGRNLLAPLGLGACAWVQSVGPAGWSSLGMWQFLWELQVCTCQWERERIWMLELDGSSQESS